MATLSNGLKSKIIYRHGRNDLPTEKIVLDSDLQEEIDYLTDLWAEIIGTPSIDEEDIPSDKWTYVTLEKDSEGIRTIRWDKEHTLDEVKKLCDEWRFPHYTDDGEVWIRIEWDLVVFTEA